MKLTKHITLSISFCISLSSFYGQSKPKADKAFKQEEWSLALSIYNQLSSKNNRVNSKIGYCLKMLSKYRESKKVYDSFIDGKNQDYTDIYHYAEVLNMLGEYKTAIKYYAKIPSSYNKSFNVSQRIKNCRWALENENNYSSFVAVKTNLNLKGKSHGVALYEDGLIYALPQSRNKKNYYLSFSRINKDEKIGPSTDFAPNLRNDYYAVSPSEAKGTMYYVQPNQANNRISSTKGVFYSVNDYQWKWTQPKPLSINSSKYNCINPSISKDGKNLFFASDMLGGYGGFDLYVITKKSNGLWSKPVNLGKEINTQGDELYPFIISDVLYFSSKEHSGYGGLDIFVSEKIGKSWSKPFNLGLGVNSPQNDFAVEFDKKGVNAYFLSDRNEKDDLYFLKPDLEFDSIKTIVKNSEIGAYIFEPKLIIKHPKIGQQQEIGKEGIITTLVPTKGNTSLTYYAEGYKPKTIMIYAGTGIGKLREVELEPRLQGVVKNNFSNEPLKGVTVSIVEYSTGKHLVSTITDKTGKWNYVLPDDIDYKLVFTNKELKQTSYIIEAGETSEQIKYKLDNAIMRPGLGGKVEVRNIYFEHASYKIKTSGQKTLDNIVRILNENPTMEIELSAHTDMVGPKDYNLRLSTKRARSARDYLVAMGVQKSRLIYKGYGEKYIINRCTSYKAKCSEEEYAVNRRVEIKILKE